MYVPTVLISTCSRCLYVLTPHIYIRVQRDRGPSLCARRCRDQESSRGFVTRTGRTPSFELHERRAEAALLHSYVVVRSGVPVRREWGNCSCAGGFPGARRDVPSRSVFPEFPAQRRELLLGPARASVADPGRRGRRGEKLPDEVGEGGRMRGVKQPLRFARLGSAREGQEYARIQRSTSMSNSVLSRS